MALDPVQSTEEDHDTGLKASKNKPVPFVFYLFVSAAIQGQGKNSPLILERTVPCKSFSQQMSPH